MTECSIVIPFRHGARYAWSALCSAGLASRNYDSEIIICLDNPDDIERELLERKIHRVGVKVNFVENSGSGISQALNTAINFARARYIIRHDIDDIMMPLRINYCMQMFQGGADFVFGSALRFPKLKRISMPLDVEQARRKALHECPFIHPGSAFDKAALDKLGGYDPYFDGVEDFDLWSRVLWSGAVIKTDQRLHVLYRKHRKQFTRTRDGHQANLRRIEIFERNRKSTLNMAAGSGLDLPSRITT